VSSGQWKTSAGRMKPCTVFGGEENEMDKWITEEAKPRIGCRFWSSVGEGFYAFLGGWRPRIEMGHHIGAPLESALPRV
jgi:hypothetical protein